MGSNISGPSTPFLTNRVRILTEGADGEEYGRSSGSSLFICDLRHARPHEKWNRAPRPPRPRMTSAKSVGLFYPLPCSHSLTVVFCTFGSNPLSLSCSHNLTVLSSTYLPTDPLPLWCGCHRWMSPKTVDRPTRLRPTRLRRKTLPSSSFGSDAPQAARAVKVFKSCPQRKKHHVYVF